MYVTVSCRHSWKNLNLQRHLKVYLSHIKRYISPEPHRAPHSITTVVPTPDMTTRLDSSEAVRY